MVGKFTRFNEHFQVNIRQTFATVQGNIEIIIQAEHFMSPNPPDRFHDVITIITVFINQ